MKTIEDLSKKELTELDDTQVVHYIKVALMKEGLVKPAFPVLEEITEVNISPSIVGYEIGGIVFDSYKKAADFLNMNPMTAEYEYEVGYDKYYLKSIAEKTNERINKRDYYSNEDIFNNLSVLKENKRKKAENEKRTQEYEKLNRECSEVESSVRSLIEQAWQERYKAENIIATYNEFYSLADKNKEVALKFLAKKYSWSEIEEAAGWFTGSSLNIDYVSVPPEPSIGLK